MARMAADIDYQKLASAILQQREARADAGLAPIPAQDAGFAIFAELMDGLKPLAALMPSRGQLEPEESRKLLEVRQSLARLDLNDAVRPDFCPPRRDNPNQKGRRP